MKEKLKNNWVYILFYIMFLALNIFSIIGIDQSNLENLVSIFSDPRGIYMAIFTIIASLIFFFLLFNADKKEKIISKIFIIMIIFFGIFYMIIVPLGRTPDERSHIIRAYDILEGRFTATFYEEYGNAGSNMPAAINRSIFNDGKEVKPGEFEGLFKYFERISSKEINEEERDLVGCNNTALYTTITYIPQSLGMFIAKLFTNNVMIILYNGRLMNLLIYALLMYLAYQIIPFKKLAVAIIALLPITIQSAISFAPDGIIIAMSILFLSYILRIKYDENKKVTKKDIILLGSMSIYLALVKIVYLPICFSIFLLPKEKLKNKKQKWIITIGIFTISLIFILSWIAFTSNLYITDPNSKADSNVQLEYILSNPIKYIEIVIRTTNYYFDNIIKHIAGEALGVMDINIGGLYKNITLIILILALFLDNKKEENIDIISKIIMCISFLGVVGLTYTGEYLKWTLPKAEIIEGLQGRYFVPILIFLPFIFSNKYIVLNKKFSYRLLFMIICFINIHALNCLLYSIVI